MTAEKFCLRWNDFEGNISAAFQELRDDKDFFDVTLVCDDEQIQAHRVILSACSPFFRNVLRRNPHQHPLLYLKGVAFNDLQSVLNFMYHGEVNVAQEELNSFLTVAEDLKVKGLTQSQQGSQVRKQESSTLRQKEKEVLPPKTKKPPPSINRNSYQNTSSNRDEIQEVVHQQSIKSEPRETSLVYSTEQNQAQALPVEEHSVATYQGEEVGYEEDYSEYDNQTDQMEFGNNGAQNTQNIIYDDKEVEVRTPEDLLKFVLPGDSGFVCSYCAKVFPNKRDVRNHLESIHFPNYFTYSCEQCGKEFKSLNSRNIHMTRNHNKPKKISGMF